METPPLDAPIVIASLIILAVLLTSATLWIRQVQRPRELIETDVGVDAWSIGWVNFGIFICAMIIAVFVAQQLGLALILGPEAGSVTELTPWLAVGAVILLQGPMLAVFYLARRCYPGFYACRLSQIDLSFGASFKIAVPLFFMLLPVIWIATLLWSNVLSGLQQAGMVEEFAPQQLVTLFQSGGDWAAMFLLMLMAVIVAPVVEELIFRGCIYRFLKSQINRFSAQLVSGTVFAVLHANVLSFVPLVVVGIVLARVYEKTGSMAVAIWFHAFFNAFSLLMLYISSLSDAIPQ